MPQATANPAKTLFKRLRAAGFSIPYVKKTVLPDWWDESLGRNQAGYLETLGHVSKGLGIKIESLLDPALPLNPSPSTEKFNLKFKASASVKPEELGGAVGVAISVARTAAEADESPICTLPKTAKQVRLAILRNHKCVNFENLLEYCWGIGVIVIPITVFPSKKPDGMALLVGLRPVIILSKSSPHPAWSAFDLAHELGHIVLGHVEPGGVVMDADLNATDTSDEERQANDFAAELLMGSADTTFNSERRISGERLAASAKSLGRQMCVDPGVIILNYARTMQREGLDCWASAQNALKTIPSDTRAHDLMYQTLLAKLDFELLGRDTANWLLRATKASG